MTWWSKASREARRAQVAAGIGLGLTARQVALASEAPMRAVYNFARANDLRFPVGPKGSAFATKKGPAYRARRDYFHGTPRPDPETSDLCTIMGEGA